jgi:parvulin-like peptidyl-prolyl isomerase
MKRLKIILLAVLVMLAIYCGKDSSEAEKTGPPPPPKPSPQEIIDNKIVLQINLDKFSNKDFKNFIQVQYSGIAGEKPNPRLISRLFDSFIEHKMVSHIANQYKIPVDELEYNKYVSKLNATGPGEQMNKKAVMEAIRVQKYLYQTVYKPIEVSKQEVREYYNNHMDNYRRKSQVLLHQILVKDRETAIKIRGELKNFPSRFAAKAKEHSISMEARGGGLMGYFEEGTLPKDMESVVFSLPTHTISPVVESTYGFHIFKVTKKKRARLLYIKTVEEEIKNTVLSDKLRVAYRQFMIGARGQLRIVINHKDLYLKYHPAPGPQDHYNEGDPNYETSNSNDNITGNDTNR